MNVYSKIYLFKKQIGMYTIVVMYFRKEILNVVGLKSLRLPNIFLFMGYNAHFVFKP